MLGVNFFGDLHGNGSLSEVARTTADTLQRKGIQFTYTELNYPYDSYRSTATVAERFQNLPGGKPYPVNLMCWNLHIFPTTSDEELAALTEGKYTIGSWVWEMQEVPELFIEQLGRLDEVWVPSTFNQRNLAAVSPRAEVYAVAHPIEVLTSPNPQRADFGLPDDRYIFLYAFSALSGDGRKNPWGVIEAFKRAFGKSDKDSPLLVLKSQHGAYYPEFSTAFSKAVEEVGGILIEETYTRQHMNDLLACIDAFVSLHRAEGFGMILAEAMALGKPTIATHYSGNLDFMNSENSYLIDYILRPIVKEDHRFRPELLSLFKEGMLWADPDLDHAAHLMQHLYENPDEGREKGARATVTIKEKFSPDAVGEVMYQRIKAATEKSI